MSGSGWRTALRLAWREAKRARGRSALVVALIALPVLAGTAFALIARTVELEPSERLTRELGRADARVSEPDGASRVLQSPDGQSSSSGGKAKLAPGRRGQSRSAVASRLPSDWRLVGDGAREAFVRTRAGLAPVVLRRLDLADPLADGILRRVSGRAPRGASEVAISPRTAEVTGAKLGSSVKLTRPARTLRVVGLVENPDLVQEALVVGAKVPVAPTEYLVDAPAPVAWRQVLALNARGLFVQSRAVVLDPPPDSEVRYSGGEGSDAAAIAVGVLVIGLAMLEICLLAGAALAVGARRQRRTLALTAVAGGDRADLRRVVLATGVVLGALGASLGLVLGVVAVAAGLPVLESLEGKRFGGLDLRPAELGAFVLVGVGAALLAAVVPARGAARRDVLTALSGRPEATGSRRRWTLAGAGVVAAGVAVAAAGASNEKSGVILAGGALAQLGLILATPALVGTAGRAGRLLPLAGRLALRDVARNRPRTTPAIAAIMTAVAGAVTASTVVHVTDANDRASYSPRLLPGQAAVLTDGLPGERVALARAPLRAELSRVLPARAVALVFEVGSECTPPCRIADVVDPGAGQAPGSGEGADFEQSGVLVAGDASTLRALVGRAPASARAVLGRGGIVTLDPGLVRHGRATLEIAHLSEDGGGGPTGRRRLEAVTVAPPAAGDALGVGDALPAGMVSPRTARRLGLGLSLSRLVVAMTRASSDVEVERANAALARAGSEAQLEIEEGYVSNYAPGLLALAVGSGLVALLGASIATSLALAEGAADQATLAAVGAGPHQRRVLAMSQAATVALLGAGLGVVAGLVPGLAYAKVALVAGIPGAQAAEGVDRARAELIEVIPWPTLATVLLVVPLVAALLAGALTRSNVPLTRRVA